MGTGLIGLCLGSGAIAQTDDQPVMAASSGKESGSLTRQARFALIVGNSAYGQLTPLRNPKHDAHDMCVMLSRLQFATTCLYDVAHAAAFASSLVHFLANIPPNSTILVYYAGHGVQFDGRNYLLPTSSRISSASDIGLQGIPLGQIFQSLSRASSALNIIILDTCRDDPFRSSKADVASRGLAREEPPSNSVLVFSTAPGSEAYDGQGRNGLFTAHLLKELGRPGPQIGEMLQRVARSVENESNAQYRRPQIPYRAFSYSGDFCFGTCEQQRITEEVQELRQQRNEAMRRIRELESSPSDAVSAASGEASRLRTLVNDLNDRSAELERYRARIAELEQASRVREQQALEKEKKESAARTKIPVIPAF